MKLRIAVAQLKINHLPRKNLEKAERLIIRASKQKADIIVFPEDFVTGPIPFQKHLADSDNSYRQHFKRLAEKHSIDIVPGSIIEQDKKGLHNTTYYIDRNGKVLARYRKINLWHPERSYINPGRETTVFRTSYGKAGLAICWDLMFPELFRDMAKKGVQVVFCPSYWCHGDGKAGKKTKASSETKLVDAVCVARAFENSIIVVYCNAAGKMQLTNGKRIVSDTLIGHSQVAAPLKGCIAKLNHDKEALLIKEVDLEILKQAEKAYGVRRDSLPNK